jgi:hypothetical protein
MPKSGLKVLEICRDFYKYVATSTKFDYYDAQGSVFASISRVIQA